MEIHLQHTGVFDAAEFLSIHFQQRNDGIGSGFNRARTVVAISGLGYAGAIVRRTERTLCPRRAQPRLECPHRGTTQS